MVIKHGKYAIVLRPVAVVLCATIAGIVAWRFLATGGAAVGETVAATSRVVSPIQNPDFEGEFITAVSESEEKLSDKKAVLSGKVGQYWKDRSRWADVEVAYTQETKKPHGGKFCQKMEITAIRTGNVKFCQGVRTLPGKNYRMSLWVRADRPTKLTLGLRQIRAEKYDAMRVFDVDAGWKELVVEGTASGPLSYFMLETDKTGVLYLDDATFVEK